MQRHKIVAPIILLILYAINFALAAPVFVQGIREVRTDAAGDVTTALRKRWKPSEEWSTNAPDRDNEPQDLASSDSELGLELPVGRDPNFAADTLSSSGSIDPDFPDPLPWPADSPSPEHNNLRQDLGLNTFSDLNAETQPSLSLGLGLGQTDGTGSSFPSHLAGSSTLEHPDPYRLTGFDPSSDAMTYPWEWGDMRVTWNHPPSDANPSPRLGLGHDNLDEDSDPPLLSLGPKAPLVPPSDPGPSTWPHFPSPVSSKWVPPQDPGPSKWAHPLYGGSEPQNLDPSRWVHPLYGEPNNPDPSTWGATWEYPNSSPPPGSNPPPQHGDLDEYFNRPLSRLGPTDDQPPPTPPPDPGPSTWGYPLRDPGLPTWAPHPPDPPTWWVTWNYPSQSPSPDPNPSLQHGNLDQPRPSPPLDPGPSTRLDPPSADAGPSTPHPLPNSGPQQHESDFFIGDLLRDGRVKRQISDSHPVNGERLPGYA